MLKSEQKSVSKFIYYTNNHFHRNIYPTHTQHKCVIIFIIFRKVSLFSDSSLSLFDKHSQRDVRVTMSDEKEEGGEKHLCFISFVIVINN